MLGPTSSDALSIQSRMRRAANPWSQAVKPESLLLTAVLALCIASPAIYQSSQHSDGVGPPERLSDRGRTQPTQQHKRALVVYVYSGNDPEYEANLRFFVREAIKVSRAGRLLVTLDRLSSHRCVVAMSIAILRRSPSASPRSRVACYLLAAKRSVV